MANPYTDTITKITRINRTFHTMTQNIVKIYNKLTYILFICATGCQTYPNLLYWISFKVHMQYYIYKTTNRINGKSYIGQHKVPSNPEAFMRYLGSGIAIKSAIQQYGKSCFTKEILEYIDDDYKHLTVSEREKYYITLYNTISPNGYNISPGGEGGCTGESHRKSVITKMKNGYRPSEEVKRKISLANKGRPKSTIHKQHLSEHHRYKHSHLIVFEDGRPPKSTMDSVHQIAAQYHIAERSLIRASMRNIFISGIKLPEYYDARWELHWKLTQYGLFRNPINNKLVTYMSMQHTYNYYKSKLTDLPNVLNCFETFTEEYLCKQTKPLNIQLLKNSDLFTQTIDLRIT